MMAYHGSNFLNSIHGAVKGFCCLDIIMML